MPHDVYLIHRDYDVFLGGSYDTRHLTQSFTTSNFYGSIYKVRHVLLLSLMINTTRGHYVFDLYVCLCVRTVVPCGGISDLRAIDF